MGWEEHGIGAMELMDQKAWNKGLEANGIKKMGQESGS